jgi:hypothetical protein
VVRLCRNPRVSRRLIEFIDEATLTCQFSWIRAGLFSCRDSHIGGGVNAFNIKSFVGKVEERPVVAASKLQCGRALILDERSIAIRSKVRTPKRGINLWNDPGIELC